MKNIIEIDDLNFSYKDKKVFNSLKLSIKEGSFTTVLGINGSGKTTLLKLILGLLRGNSVIMCENLPVMERHLKTLRKEIGVVYENENFVNETVMDEIAFTLENLNLDREEIRKRVNSISNKLKIKNILEKEPYSISNEEKWLVSLASALVINPNILFIDNGFKLNPKKRKLVLEVLEKYNKKGMTIINFTSNVEEVLYGDEVIVLNNGKVILEGKKEDVLENEEVLEKVGLGVPFIVALSNKLKFYDLIDKTYFEEEKLVDDLWK